MGRTSLAPSETCQAIDCEHKRWRDLKFHGARVAFCCACWKRAARTGHARRSRRPKLMHVSYARVESMMKERLGSRKIAAALDAPEKRIRQIMREIRGR